MTGETLTTIVYGTCLGIVATLTMDLLANLTRRIGITAGAKGLWVGRWYLGIARGKLVHDDITLAPEQRGERIFALIGHHVVGIVLAIVYVFCSFWLGFSPGGFLTAVGYGLATCVFPFFLLYPSFGFGLLGLKGSSELKLIRSSVVNHFFYGFGLWWPSILLPLSS